jgi:hypothetical protein
MNRTYNVHTTRVREIPSLQWGALEGDHEHAAEAPEYSDRTCQVHHPPMFDYWRYRHEWYQ